MKGCFQLFLIREGLRRYGAADDTHDELSFMEQVPQKDRSSMYCKRRKDMLLPSMVRRQRFSGTGISDSPSPRSRRVGEKPFRVWREKPRALASARTGPRSAGRPASSGPGPG